MSEEEAAAEQPVRWLEPAEEDSGSSDDSDEGGSVAGAGGQGEGGPAGATPGKAAAASAPFDSLLVGNELPNGSMLSHIPVPARHHL